MKQLTQSNSSEKRPRINGVHKVNITPKGMTRNEMLYNSLPRPINHHLDACPICGDYEGDEYDCPNGCHQYNIPKEWHDFNPDCTRSETNEPSMRGE